MGQDIYLTGITTTGTPHIGNYVGAIRPGIEASKDLSTQHFYFLADYHSLAKNEDSDKIGRSTLEIAASWLVTRNGVPTGLVSVPNRYMHSPNEIVSVADLFHTAELIAAFIRRLGPDTDFTPR